MPGFSTITGLSETYANTLYALKSQGIRDLTGTPRFVSANDIRDDAATGSAVSPTANAQVEIAALEFTFVKDKNRTFVQGLFEMAGASGTTGYCKHRYSDGTITKDSPEFSQGVTWAAKSYSIDLWTLDNGTITVKIIVWNNVAGEATSVRNIKVRSQQFAPMN